MDRSGPGSDAGATFELIRGELPRDLAAAAESLTDNPYACLVATRAYAPDLAARLHHLVVRTNGRLRGVLSFERRGHVHRVVNQCLSLPGNLLAACADHLFVEYPEVVRVDLVDAYEVDLPAAAARRPTRRISRGVENFVLRLPASVEAYHGAFSARTRQKLRNYERRLLDAHPAARFTLVAREATGPSLINAVVSLNQLRMEAKGGASLHDEASVGGLVAMSRTHGVVGVWLDGERVLAGAICAKVGSGWTLMVIAHDPACDPFSLGTLCLVRTIEEAIADGAAIFNLLWGKYAYKERLGGELVPLADLRFYRGRTAWLRDWTVLIPSYVSTARRLAWRLRKRAHLGRLLWWRRPRAEPGESAAS